MLALGVVAFTAANAGGSRIAFAAGASPSIRLVQFRFPWEAQRRPAKRAKRPAKPKSKPAAPARERSPATKPAQPPTAAAAAPAAPTLLAPPGLLVFSGPKGAEADWRALAAQIPPPEAAPPLPPEGPAPAPMWVVALMPPATQPVEQTDETELERDHVPLPPRRPGSETATSQEAETPAAPLPPEKPGDMKSAALIPKAPLPAGPAEPGPPDLPLPETAREDDPDCQALDKSDVVISKPLPSIEGPGVCGAGPLVELSGVKTKNGETIDLKPAATLRCEMARVVAAWLRDDLAPAASAAGVTLARLNAAGSYSCRGRNNVSGGKMSEHGRANALDVAGFTMADGKSYAVYAKDMPETFASVLRGSACGRFNTVLGEGSDAAHATHLHVDLQPRKSRHNKLCQWDGDEEPEPAKEEKSEDAK
ncbi:extensin family protein [Hansschlegelia quercus]|uniref:extensin-like domain-containing protein n=1 Tax=Hansschlegelia quercus TaxID=2528245 RepID=UPI0013EF4361|nr:extensin family protein [Hansschlegelia quercus]